MLLFVLIVHAVLVAITVTAALIDWKTGHIPNWLTLPWLVIGPVFWLFASPELTGDLFMFWASLGGIAVSAIIPYIMFRKGAMGGGDVKLFMAIGAIGGIFLAIEAQFLAFIAGGILSLARLAWNGKLFRTVGNAFYLGVNPVLPKKYRKEISPELLTMFRFGASIAIGTALAVLLKYDRLFL